MTIEWSRNDVKRNFGTACILGNDNNVRYLLYHKTRIGYNAGVYGHNYDLYYECNNCYIVGGRTDYAGFPRVSAGLVLEYETNAKHIVDFYRNNQINYNDMCNQLNDNLRDFSNKVYGDIALQVTTSKK